MRASLPGMRAGPWLPLILALGCQSPTTTPAPPTPTAPPAPTAPALPVAPPPAPIPSPAIEPERPPPLTPVPADGYAVSVQIYRGPEGADGRAPWTRLALSVVDVTGNEQAAAATERFPAKCSDAEVAEGDLARWTCWWAGSGWNLRLQRDRGGVTLRSQETDEGMKRPAKWREHLRLAVPAGAPLVVQRPLDRDAAADTATVPAPPRADARPITVHVKIPAHARGGAAQPSWGESELRVRDGAAVYAAVLGPRLPPGAALAGTDDPAALRAWKLEHAGVRQDARLIQAGRRVVLQTRPHSDAAPEPWQDAMRVALPFGRAAQLAN